MPSSPDSRAGRRIGTATTRSLGEVPAYSHVTSGCGVPGAAGADGPSLLERPLSGLRPPLQPPGRAGAPFSAASACWLAQACLPMALSGTESQAPFAVLSVPSPPLRKFKVTVNSKPVGLVLG